MFCWIWVCIRLDQKNTASHRLGEQDQGGAEHHQVLQRPRDAHSPGGVVKQLTGQLHPPAPRHPAPRHLRRNTRVVVIMFLIVMIVLAFLLSVPFVSNVSLICYEKKIFLQVFNRKEKVRKLIICLNLVQILQFESWLLQLSSLVCYPKSPTMQ